jgi:hypothetical protein
MRGLILVVIVCILVALTSAQSASTVRPIFRKHPELFKVYSLLEELQVHLAKKAGVFGTEYNNLFKSWREMGKLTQKAQIVYAEAKLEVARLNNLVNTTTVNRELILKKKDAASKVLFYAKIEVRKAKEIAADALKKFQQISIPMNAETEKGAGDIKAITWLKTMVGKHHGLDCYAGKWIQVKKLLGVVHCRRVTCCKLYKQDGQWKHFCERKHRVCK